jgi:hypothetical protein
MNRQPILLDFKGRRRQGGIVGIAVLTFGAAGALLAGIQFHSSSLTLAGLELRLDNLESARDSRHRIGRALVAVAAGT